MDETTDEMSPADRRTAETILALVASGQLESIAFETYRYDIEGKGRLTWNVKAALQRAACGAIGFSEVPRAQLQRMAETWDYDAAKVSRVDCTIPGICAPILDEGQRVYIVIDGVHRCVRAYQEGKPFVCRVLSDADSRACLIEAPPGLVP